MQVRLPQSTVVDRNDLRHREIHAGARPEKDLLYCAIDVSKDKLDLDAAALALPAQLGNDQAAYRQLIRAAKKYSGPVQFVFEATGPYHLGLALALWEAQIPLSVLNPARVRYFAKAQGKAKTDPLDKQVIGDYARSFRPHRRRHLIRCAGNSPSCCSSSCRRATGSSRSRRRSRTSWRQGGVPRRP
jgi:transposase